MKRPILGKKRVLNCSFAQFNLFMKLVRKKINFHKVAAFLSIITVFAVLPIAKATTPEQRDYTSTGLYFKQRSGPPTEFSSMAPADPLMSAEHSKESNIKCKASR